jgi:hypothetical protein
MAPLTIGCILSLALGQIIVPPIPLQASPLRVASGRILYSYPSPPSGSSIRGNRGGGGHKGSCYATKLPLTALIPEKPSSSDPQSFDVWGRTVAERPTLWFYAPYVLKDDMPTQFLLQDSNSKEIYRTSVQLPKNPGVISIKLPASVALQVNQFYQWSLDVKCDNPGMSVAGWIQRVELPPSANQRLATAQGLKAAAIYAENGVWFDALTVLADDRSSASFTQNWTDLLNQIGLGEIAQQPIVR